MQIERGTVFGHRYVVQSQVGTGGMATVYRGTDQTLDRLVAIKVMLERYAQDPSFAARFKQEAQAAAALQSPYIVSVYDWGQEGDTYYIIMEYLHGTDLKTGIRSHGALAPRKVAQIGAQVCQALSVAHAHEIIHRDIKPQNIMIQPNGDAKVMDFGIARSKNSHLTQTNSVLGTAHYVSPEQAQGKELGPTSDLYSLGVVMYEAATGKLPFDGDDAVSVALKQVNEEPIPPNEVNPNIDDDLNAIIMKCMMKNPAERFQTADELRRVLNNYIMGRPLNLGPRTTVLAGSRTNVLPKTDQTRPIGMQPISPIASRTTAQPHVTPRATPASREAEEPARSGLPGPAIAAIVVVALVVIILVIVFAVRGCSGAPGSRTPSGGAASSATESPAASAVSEQVSVPNVVGMTVSEATAELQSAGLSVGTQTNQTSNTVARGQIISQTPAANSSAAKGSKITIVVSTGPDTVTLPASSELKGLSESAAVERLKALGLTNVTHDPSLDDYDQDAAEGTFLTLDPTLANKTNITTSTEVRYGLSKGAPAVVPTVAGTYYTDAESALHAAGLSYAENWVNDNNASQGYVISADPADGSQVDPGTTVTLTISNGPSQVSVPDVTGWNESDAENFLSGSNLSYTVTYTSSSSVESGRVISMSPSAGSSVNAGSTITLTVSSGSASNGSTTTSGTNGGSSGSGGFNGLVGGSVDAAKSAVESQGYWWRVNGFGSTVTGISVDPAPSSDGHTYVTITTS